MNIWHHFFKDGSQWKQYNITHFDHLKHLSYWSYACCSKRCCFCFLKKEEEKKSEPGCVPLNVWSLTPGVSPPYLSSLPPFLQPGGDKSNPASCVSGSWEEMKQGGGGYSLLAMQLNKEWWEGQRVDLSHACMKLYHFHCTEYWRNTTNMERWTQEEKGHQQSRAYCPSHFPFDNWIHFYKLKCGHISIWLADFMLHTYWI